MASVTQCDVCSNVVKHEESKYVEIHSVIASDDKNRKLHQIEVCQRCYEAICEICGLEVKK